MAHDVAGNTYEFETALPEYAEDVPEEAKAMGLFAVAFFSEAAKGSTLTFRENGTAVLHKQEGSKGKDTEGTYTQEGDKLTLKGFPKFPEEGLVEEDALDFVQGDKNDKTGRMHLRFKKV